jgi:hypothetical protein
LIEDVSTGASDEDLGEKLQGYHVLLVHLQVILEEFCIFGKALNKKRVTDLNWM